MFQVFVDCQSQSKEWLLEETLMNLLSGFIFSLRCLQVCLTNENDIPDILLANHVASIWNQLMLPSLSLSTISSFQLTIWKRLSPSSQADCLAVMSVFGSLVKTLRKETAWQLTSLHLLNDLFSLKRREFTFTTGLLNDEWKAIRK